MGFMNSTFPLAVYGLQDAFSGYILYFKLWTTNADPKLIGCWYMDHLYRTKVISKYLRLDRGTETGHMATIHAFLRQDQENELGTVFYGPSTNNKIEKWWRDLHHRFERFFKRQLTILFEQSHYDPSKQNHFNRQLLPFIFLPVIQKEMETFRETVWNAHSVRSQREAQMPKGIPYHLYSFPEHYSADKFGLQVTQEALDDVATISGVMSVGDD
ncbi:uncharacterized protein LOC141893927 [Acropora palmata]|uniref:uncharacterized protein LOC141893927 n=1 Tax=Acropora palmata TaxID=6131 RepID=UPI003DA0E38A